MRQAISFIFYMVIFVLLSRFIFAQWEKNLVHFFVKHADAHFTSQEGGERDVAFIISGWGLSFGSYFIFLSKNRFRNCFPLLIVVWVILTTRGYLTYLSKLPNDLLYSLKYVYSQLLILFYVMFIVFNLITVLLTKKPDESHRAFL
ncbi:MAG: hypothetical protein KBB37_08575 [Bacteroidia bacterium]|nr:hypothetical protein [Bacteroidia bacterium]MBP7261324.1 hypothetical protein [Bacteroidia bacterium]MBP9180635.1 hypothetical protein [Bacteroidia bacterium]MBP9724973.1 hypothetical protein [Bacteroidia bacterium]